MKNAFEKLGATPLDDGSKLQELFEEKQLLLDDDKELADAYAELANPKKRIKHEIEYLAKDDFELFRTLFMDNAEVTQKMVVADICEAIIDLGKWFDASADEIFTQINDNREVSGFATLANVSVVATAIAELKLKCVSAVTKYFNYFDEKGLVSIFNALVKRSNFQSFFVDELMAHYEMKIGNTLLARQKECESKFAEVERLCQSFNSGGSFPYDLDSKVTEFKRMITAWDNLAQPLQVNSQQHGASHDTSAELVHGIRNRVIELCNKSQEALNSTISTLQFSHTAKHDLSKKLAESVMFADIIIKLLDILKKVFDEIALTAEQLQKDKKDILELKANLSSLLAKIDPYGIYGQRTSSTPGGNAKYSSSSSGGGIDKDQARKVWLISLLIASFIMMLVTFINSIIWAGILSSILVIGSILLLWFQKKDLPAKVLMIVASVLTVVFLITMFTSIGVGSRSDEDATYMVTLNRSSGTGGTSSITATYGKPLPSATAPTRSGYTFGGYYSSSKGNGTQYYNASMKSAKNWDNRADSTLYAKWIYKSSGGGYGDYDEGIKLTASNFETYFTLTSSCSVRSSGNQYYESYYADYSYSIAPKMSFKYGSNSKNPSSITVTIGFDTSSFSTSYGTPSANKITVTLYRSSGYKTSGNKSFTCSQYDKYWDDGIYSASGTVFN